MNTITRLAAWIAALVVAGLLGLTACSSAPAAGPRVPHEIPGSVIVIAGVHQGMPAAVVPVQLADTLTAATAAGASLTVIAADGTPKRIYHSSDYTISTANDEARHDDVTSQVNALTAAVTSAVADSDGADLGGALRIAADQARADHADKTLVIVIDNGISDRGFPVLTASGMTGLTDTTALTAFARDHHYLIDVPKGTSIDLVGFGYTAAPQPELTGPQRDAIVRVWSAFLTESGASVDVLATPRSGAGPDTHFTTGVVAAGSYDAFTFEEHDGTREAELPADVLFDSGSAVLRDDPQTSKALRHLAAQLGGYVGHLTISGYTDAVGSVEDNLALSRERALAVRAWFIAAGAMTKKQATICAFGESDPAVPHASTDAERQADRRVVIVLGARSC